MPGHLRASRGVPSRLAASEVGRFPWAAVPLGGQFHTYSMPPGGSEWRFWWSGRRATWLRWVLSRWVPTHPSKIDRWALLHGWIESRGRASVLPRRSGGPASMHEGRGAVVPRSGDAWACRARGEDCPDPDSVARHRLTFGPRFVVGSALAFWRGIGRFGEPATNGPRTLPRHIKGLLAQLDTPRTAPLDCPRIR
jgi:hypothetical protein